MPPVLKPNPPNRAAGTVPVKTTVKRTVKPKAASGRTKAPKQGEHGPKDAAPATPIITKEGETRGGS